MGKIQNFCTVSEASFKDEHGVDVNYRRVVWHIGNTVIELVPVTKSKQALQVLIDLGLIDVVQGV